jgi:hypothetical protein
MLTTGFLLQEAKDLFDPIAGLNEPGVLKSFSYGLDKAREHLIAAKRLVESGGKHEDLCYEFHVGTSLIMSLLDGIAVYVEKKVATPPVAGVVYWASASTFSDPRFAALKVIQQRTCEYIIKGGITVNSLRNFCKHYLPWLPLASCGNDGMMDIRFPVDASTRSGPVLRGILFPLFNDARAACMALGGLIGQDVTVIQQVHLL